MSDPLVLESLAAGALLFQKADSHAFSHCWRDHQECILYMADNCEALLEHYLTHEEERRVISAAGPLCAERLGFANLWEEALTQLTAEGLSQRPPASRHARIDWPARVWQTLDNPTLDGAQLVELHPMLSREQTSPTGTEPAARFQALAFLTALAARNTGPGTVVPFNQIVDWLEHAVRCAPDDALAGLNLAEALLCVCAEEKAISQARRILTVLEHLPEDHSPRSVDFGLFPAGFHLFRVEWEKTAWCHAGDPMGERRAKQTLVSWRLHTSGRFDTRSDPLL